MPDDFKHIIVTRFNSALDHEFKKALDPHWLNERWPLFEQYTIPSMLAQSCQRFYWIIEFHPESPDFLKSIVKNANWPSNFIASFGERNQISDRLGLTQVPTVLTSRIDSDDAFHRNAVSRIQESERNCDIMNFEHGYQLDHETGCIALMHRHCSPFATKVNRISKGEDPYETGGNHTLLSSKFSYMDISGGDPMFVQVLHGKNVENAWYYNPFNNRVLSAMILKKSFNVEQSHFQGSRRLKRAASFEFLRFARFLKRAILNRRSEKTPVA